MSSPRRHLEKLAAPAGVVPQPRGGRSRRIDTSSSSTPRETPRTRGNPAKLRPPWKPGQCGNPQKKRLGRPKGVKALIESLLGGEDCPTIWHAYYALALGNAKTRQQTFAGEKVRVDAGVRLQALDRLRDSGPGRPPQTLAHTGDDGGPIILIGSIPNPGTVARDPKPEPDPT